MPAIGQHEIVALNAGDTGSAPRRLVLAHPDRCCQPYDASADEDPEQGHHDHPRLRTAFHVTETTGLEERAPAPLHKSIVPTQASGRGRASVLLVECA